MEELTFAQLDAEAELFDRAVLATEGVDAFCSSTTWVLPAHYAFGPARPSWLFRGEGGYVALALAVAADGARLLQPLEAAWAFASPVVGRDLSAVARDLAALLARRARSWDAALLTGVPEGSPLFARLVEGLAPRFRLLRGDATRRYRASLLGGYEGFLARRSRDFRKSVKRAQRRGGAEGITFEAVHEVPLARCDAVYARVLAVEAKSWKGREGVGIQASEMQEFYRLMMPRLAGRGALRLWFARRDGIDVGYILGGLFSGTYRGLQFSYAAELEHIGLGNLMQLHAIEQLSGEGIATYDLGSDVPYKARWGDEALATTMVIVTK